LWRSQLANSNSAPKGEVVGDAATYHYGKTNPHIAEHERQH